MQTTHFVLYIIVPNFIKNKSAMVFTEEEITPLLYN